MKLLWFEVTEPSTYSKGMLSTLGWQDSLERIVRTVPEIELSIAFVSEKYTEIKNINGVTYIPIYTHSNFYERYIRKVWDVYVDKILPSAVRIVENIKPDIIHIFGTEWPFGQIAKYTSVPIVVHIMGAIIPYLNAAYPPGFSVEMMYRYYFFNPKKFFLVWKYNRDYKNRAQLESKTWKLVSNYMGRTLWDKSLSNVMHPGRNYFHVDEALRKEFLSGLQVWNLPTVGKIKLVSVGCADVRKGTDLMLKVAKVLKENKIDFEWNVIGHMHSSTRLLLEKRTGIKFDEVNIKLLDNKTPEDIIKIFCESTIYVHTAYIDNSPNSICEAQCIGMPIISTNVGGIPTLVRDGIEGELVPSNDPWTMADRIMELASNQDKLEAYSKAGRETAMKRHNDSNIKEQLLSCYREIIKIHRR